MSERLSEREKLIKRINEAMFRDEDKGCVKPSEIADFILADRARIVRPAKAFRLSKIEVSETWPENDAEIVIDEIVKRAGGE